MAIPGPGIPGLKPGGTIRTSTGQRYLTTYRPNGNVHFSQEMFNKGGQYIGLEGANGQPRPVNMFQAFKNAGGKLPTAPRAAGAPGGAGGSAAPPAAAAGSSPLDATYSQNVADNQFKVNNQINALALSSAQGWTGLQSALAQLQYAQPRAQLALEQKANAGGSLYSSNEAQNQANLAYQYAGQEGAAQSNYSNLAAQNASQIDALQQGVPIYNSGQALASTLRAAAAAQKDPTLGQPPAVSPGGPGAGPNGLPPGYATPAQAEAQSRAAAARGGVGMAPRGMPAAGRVLNFNGQQYRVAYDAAGQIRFTRVGGR